jgi:hypothetical protein
MQAAHSKAEAPTAHQITSPRPSPERRGRILSFSHRVSAIVVWDMAFEPARGVVREKIDSLAAVNGPRGCGRDLRERRRSQRDVSEDSDRKSG